MWLFLWVVFVLTAIGFFLWSYHAIYEQKRGWKAFAKKYGLNYVGGTMMQPPSMTGEVKGRLVNFYSQIIDTPQGQKISKNVVEVFLNDVPDLLCVVASPGFSDFVTLLDLPEPFTIDHPQWPKTLLARTFEDEAPEIWFLENEKRIQAIEKLNKLPFDTAFLCDGEQSFIAIRTSNPLSNSTQLNKVMGALFDAANNLASVGQSSDMIKNPNEDKDTDEPDDVESRL